MTCIIHYLDIGQFLQLQLRLFFFFYLFLTNGAIFLLKFSSWWHYFGYKNTGTGKYIHPQLFNTAISSNEEPVNKYN